MLLPFHDDAFDHNGYGTYVLTATDTLQYAWEGNKLEGGYDKSLFTHHLIDGLRTGQADIDQSGQITIENLYQYVHDKVRDDGDATRRQTPTRWINKEVGSMVIARNPIVLNAPPPPKYQGEISLSHMRRIMLEHLDAEEIKDISLDLNIPLQSLRDAPSDLAHRILAQLDEREHLPELMNWLWENKPELCQVLFGEKELVSIKGRGKPIEVIPEQKPVEVPKRETLGKPVTTSAPDVSYQPEKLSSSLSGNSELSFQTIGAGLRKLPTLVLAGGSAFALLLVILGVWSIMQGGGSDPVILGPTPPSIVVGNGDESPESVAVVNETPTPELTDEPTRTATNTVAATPSPTNTPTMAPTLTEIAPSELMGFEDDEWVKIPAGTFYFGAAVGDTDADSSESPADPNFDIPYDYWISKYEVTNAQYKLFVDATGYDPPSCNWSGNQIEIGFEKHPVVCVSWNDAMVYVEWLDSELADEDLTVTLPSEPEWEKAARGPIDDRIYPWAGDFDGTKLNFCDEICSHRWADESVNDGFAKTAPVGSYPEGASPDGVEDMVGNVWEWTRSKYVDYPYDPDDGREDLDGDDVRVLRGGSWHVGQMAVRVSDRSYDSSSFRGFDYWGFRVVVVHTSSSPNIDANLNENQQEISAPIFYDVTINEIVQDDNSETPVSISGSATAESRVILAVDSVEIDLGVTSEDGTWSFIGFLPSGSYTVKAYVFDNVEALTDPIAVASQEVEIKYNETINNATPDENNGLFGLVFDSLDSDESQSVGSDSIVGVPAFELIFDASWSMTFPLDSNEENDRLTAENPDSRIAIAQASLVDLIESTLPEDTYLAIRAFGNIEGNLACRTDLMAPLQPLSRVSRTNLAAVINGIDPQFNANTAIAAALLQAGKDLAESERENIIVLLIDGQETCGGDPAAVIESLVTEDNQVSVNVIGFAIQDDELKELFAEWAEIGNGQYFDAPDADLLEESLKQALTVGYKILDTEGNHVKRGVVGGQLIQLDQGIYNVFNKNNDLIYENVVVLSNSLHQLPNR